jgi:hypothetical protein
VTTTGPALAVLFLYTYWGRLASTGVKKELLRAQVQGSWLNRLENVICQH